MNASIGALFVLLSSGDILCLTPQARTARPEQQFPRVLSSELVREQKLRRFLWSAFFPLLPLTKIVALSLHFVLLAFETKYQTECFTDSVNKKSFNQMLAITKLFY